MKEDIKINYTKIMKLSNYITVNYTYYHETLEIASNSKAFSKMEYFSTDKVWQMLLEVMYTKQAKEKPQVISHQQFEDWKISIKSTLAELEPIIGIFFQCNFDNMAMILILCRLLQKKKNRKEKKFATKILFFVLFLNI